MRISNYCTYDKIFSYLDVKHMEQQLDIQQSHILSDNFEWTCGSIRE